MRQPTHIYKILFLLAVAVLGSVSIPAADTKNGSAAYDRECKECHAMNGAPIASVARAMKKKQVVMRDLGSKEVQALKDAEWKKMVLEGTGKMQPVKTFKGAELDDVLAYMRTLKK